MVSLVDPWNQPKIYLHGDDSSSAAEPFSPLCLNVWIQWFNTLGLARKKNEEWCVCISGKKLIRRRRESAGKVIIPSVKLG